MFGRLGEEMDGQLTAAHGMQKTQNADLYLREKSGHRPTEKRAVLSSIVPRANIICYAGNLTEEVEYLKEA